MAPVDFSIDRIGLDVTTGVASSNAKIVIYNSGTDGYPSSVAYTGGNLDCSSVAFVEETLSFTFTGGRRYWIGVRTSSTQQLRGASSSTCATFGLTASNANTMFSILRRTVTYASAAPDPWVFTSSELTAANPPSVRMRKA